jgi:hypothetical protein
MIDPAMQRGAGEPADEKGCGPSATSRRLAVGSISFAAALALAAAGLQLLEGGQGTWRGLGAAGLSAWWLVVAIFLSRK